jgi:hypothetical protein
VEVEAGDAVFEKSTRSFTSSPVSAASAGVGP